MSNRNSTRSAGYQHTLIELSLNPLIINDLSIAQGMNYKLRPDVYDERILDLKDALKARMWELIETGLTERQKQVIKLSMEGLTQNEIAKKLGINQTSVHKVLKGNIDYKNSRRRYGGAIKKIIKLCQADEQIQKILKELQEAHECLEL